MLYWLLKKFNNKCLDYTLGKLLKAERFNKELI